ncbi:MAG: hypothetical protein V3S32_10740 [Acidimicrobiia bacterium]
MSKFMMIYKGEATDMADMTEEEGAAVMAKWGVWMEKVGSALIDVGTPFGPGSSIVDDGSTGPVIGLTGYSIVEADNLAHASALTESHPYLSEAAGDYSIELFELMPVPFED